ncbi:MAG: permease-like cell division protein FtsX [Tannerella sp.]|jgi:cell division transport system permease protein|nr:permease-like cell division protein FtsX [Tannerella sp.]
MAKNKRQKGLSFFNSRVTSIISIALVLFLLGLVFLMALLGNHLSDYVKENMTFSVMLKDNLSNADIKRVQENLKALPFIRSTQYISKEQAAKEMKEELGEDPEQFLGFNPFSASIEAKLHPKYANADSLQVIERQLRSYTSVSDVLYRKDMMQMVNDNMTRAGIILLVLAMMLTAISFVLISNTIRLLIYSKRFLIHTMQLVGATAGFIRRPFIRYNLISGIVASIVAIFMLIGTLYYLQGQIANFTDLLDTGVLLMVFGAVFLLGILLSVAATAFAVNRFLRMEVDKMYYI